MKTSTVEASPVKPLPVKVTTHSLMVVSNYTEGAAERVGRLAEIQLYLHYPGPAPHIASSEVFKKTTKSVYSAVGAGLSYVLHLI